MIKVECCRCFRELDEPGGLLFAPTTGDMTFKYHLCVECWNIVIYGIIHPEDDAEVTHIFPEPAVATGTMDAISHSLRSGAIPAGANYDYTPEGALRFYRMSAVGGFCTVCGTIMSQSLVCPGCGHVDPQTSKEPRESYEGRNQ